MYSTDRAREAQRGQAIQLRLLLGGAGLRLKARFADLESQALSSTEARARC